jgi:adenine-specific DNA methylase
MLEEGYDEEYAKAVVSYLSLVLNRLADKNANLVVYNVVGEKIEHVFGRQALPMTWDYIELNVFSGGNGDWKSHHDWILNVLFHLSQIPPVEVENEDS